MLTQEKFYGQGLTFSGTSLWGVPARVLDVSGAVAGTGITLPVRTGKHPGGPYFKLINHGGSSMPLKNELGSTILTMTNNSISTVLLGTSKWSAFLRSLNTAKTFGSNSADRTSPVGTVVTPASVTIPSSYDSVTCDGGYRRARNCDTGHFAMIWMLDSEVTPHFVSSVAAFTYQGQAFYFKESDRLLTGFGFTLTAADVTWFADCTAAAAASLCDYTNPNWPRAVIIEVTDTVNTGDNNLNGTWNLPLVGSTYTVPAAIVGPSIYRKLPQPWFAVTCYCTSGGWEITLGFFVDGTVNNTAFFNFGTASVLPSLGVYPYTGSTIGSGGGPPPTWSGATVKVVGFQ